MDLTEWLPGANGLFCRCLILKRSFEFDKIDSLPEGAVMTIKKMGRRNFLKGASTAAVGLASTSFWNLGHSFADSRKADTLQYRTLGRTGLKVTTVSMGVMNCSDPSVLMRALDLGINFYDTAHSYMGGRNEEMVGSAFSGKRDKVLIQTKFQFSASEKENRRSVETSLKRLKTDYVDVLLAHSLKKTVELSDPVLLRFLQNMKKEGKARFTGFSTHTDMARLLREAAKSNLHDVVLTSYNFTHSNELKGAIASAAESGIGIVAMKTQAGGYKGKETEGLNPHQAALRYVLKDEHVAVAIPGVKTIGQIEQCAAVMGTLMTREDMADLKKYHSHIQGRFCTMCGGCQGECPKGIAHCDLLRALMYHYGYKDERLASEALTNGDNLAKLRVCSECSSCSVTCIRGLDIQAQLKKAHSIYS
jgi:predicted aldo/keto reductase-like oxidoreductase